MTKVKTGGNLIDYVAFDGNAPFAKFLTKLDIITHTRGWANTIIMLLNANGVSSNTIATINLYTNAGVFIDSVSADIPAGVMAPRININQLVSDSPSEKAQLFITQIPDTFTFLNYDFVTDLSNWTQPNSGTTTDDWDFVGGLAQRKHETQSAIAIMSHATSVTPTTKIRIRAKYQGFVPGNYTMKVYLVQDSTAYLAATYLLPNTQSILIVDDLITAPAGVGPDQFDSAYFSIEGGEATGNKMSVYYFDVSVPVTVTELKNIRIVDPCVNPVLVYFRNSLGGDTFWMFNHNQDMLYTTNIRRAKRKLVYAANLTDNEWEVLSDLNNINATYSEQINDIRDVNKTAKMIGQQVYVIDIEGEKTGVITIPTTNSTKTIGQTHQFQMEIEYPEYFTQ